MLSAFREYEDPEEYARGNVDARFNQWMRAQWERAQNERRDGDHYHHSPQPIDSTLALGYVTNDVRMRQITP